MRIGLVYGNRQLPDGSLHQQTLVRCQAALAAWREGRIDKVAITVGGSAKFPTITQAMRDWFVEQGVPAFDLMVCPMGLNTAGETRVCIDRFLGRGDEPYAISSGYHIFRIRLIWSLMAPGRLKGCFWAHGGESLRDYSLEILRILATVPGVLFLGRRYIKFVEPIPSG